MTQEAEPIHAPQLGPPWPAVAPTFGVFVDGAFEPLADTTRLSSLDNVGPDSLRAWTDRLHTAGVCTARRTSPDLMAQLREALQRPVDTVLVNLLDADGTLAINSALAGRHPLELAAGAQLLAKITKAKVWHVADARCPASWVAALRTHAKNLTQRFSWLVNDYPQSDPTLMLYTLFSRRLRPGRLPVEQGVLMVDAAAAIAVGRELLGDESAPRKRPVPLAVRDHILKHSHFVFADDATSIDTVFARAGVTANPYALIRQGDLLRDRRVGRTQTIRAADELTFHVSPPEPPINPDPCVRCGWCFEACPTRVQPANILEAAQMEDVVLAERAGIEACIDCGICSYVCPSKLPLLAGIEGMKARMRRNDE